MKLGTLSSRTAKEILRDPLNLTFGLAFPLALLLLFSVIQSNIPVPLFEIQSITPGIAVFGLSFMTLFSATLVAKDRESALLLRLYTAPLTALHFMLGYMLPLLPIALLQTVICYAVALLLGLPFSIHLLYAIVSIVPVALFFIALGLLFGSILTVKQVGGICGALLSNMTALLSGIYFDVNLLGKAIKGIANALPFLHAVEWGRAALNGTADGLLLHILVLSAYLLAALFLAAVLFLRQMKRQ